MTSKFVAISLIVGSFASVGCAEAEPEAAVAETTSESGSDALAAAACGSRYAVAQQRYELAVIAAKAINAHDVCGESTHPRNRSMVATNVVEDVEGLMMSSIQACSYFRGVYNRSVYAQPVRTVLAKSSVRGLVDGGVNERTMAGLQAKLVGATMFGPKPGVVHLFTVSFAAGNRATFSSPNWDTGVPNESVGTYRVVTGARPQIIFTSPEGSSTYNIVHRAGTSQLDFVPVGAGETISNNSDPCSA